MIPVLEVIIAQLTHRLVVGQSFVFPCLRHNLLPVYKQRLFRRILHYCGDGKFIARAAFALVNIVVVFLSRTITPGYRIRQRRNKRLAPASVFVKIYQAVLVSGSCPCAPIGRYRDDGHGVFAVKIQIKRHGIVHAVKTDHRLPTVSVLHQNRLGVLFRLLRTDSGISQAFPAGNSSLPIYCYLVSGGKPQQAFFRYGAVIARAVKSCDALRAFALRVDGA